MPTDREELRRLAAYLAMRFPEVEATAPVEMAIALLEHLWRIEGMEPPVLRTLHASRRASSSRRTRTSGRI